MPFFVFVVVVVTLSVIGAEDNGFAFDNVDRMGQRAVLQVVVDERRDDSGFGQTQPNGNVLGPILQHESDRIAAGRKARFFKQVSESVAQFADLQKVENVEGEEEEEEEKFNRTADEQVRSMKSIQVAPF